KTGQTYSEHRRKVKRPWPGPFSRESYPPAGRVGRQCRNEEVLQLLGVEEAARAEAGHRFGVAYAGEGEAAFGAAELAERLDHPRLGIPGAVDDDLTCQRVAVRHVEPGESKRIA